MKTRLGFSALTLTLVGGLGFLFGGMWTGHHPQVAFAKAAAAAQAQEPDDGKLRIIIFGAHPDDAEYRGAGVAMKWAKLGHHVKLVSATNGDIGHWQTAGGPLAQRRLKEVMDVGRRLGVTTEVVDIHDGEITPTVENRRIITKLIRQWNADIVIANRPNDYHPDHRYTSILVQDSAYMVTVPFFCPDVPALKKNPVFLYASDNFQRPNAFRADVAVDIDDVIEPTLDALLVMESQIHEGGANGYAGLYPQDEPGRQGRREEVRRNLARRYGGYAGSYRRALGRFYRHEPGRKHPYPPTSQVAENTPPPPPHPLNPPLPLHSPF